MGVLSSIFDPTIYPFKRSFTYADGSTAPPIVKSNEFYNPTQHALQALVGGKLAFGAMIVTDEFDREQPIPTSMGTFGSQLLIQKNSNIQFYSLPSLQPGEHGVWRLETTSNGAGGAETVESDGMIDPDAGFLYTARIRIGNRSRLDTVGNLGFALGMGTPSKLHAHFLCGRDQPNWFTFFNSTFVNTGVPVLDNTWYWLLISCDINHGSNPNIRFFIKQAQQDLREVDSRINPGFVFMGMYRYLRATFSTAALQRDFMDVDHFSSALGRGWF